LKILQMLLLLLTKQKLSLIAAKIQEAPEVHANLASVEMLKGNARAAYDHAVKASGLSGDNAAGLNGVKGSAEIVMAKYSAAVSC
jgi:hypothetical protein